MIVRRLVLAALVALAASNRCLAWAGDAPTANQQRAAYCLGVLLDSIGDLKDVAKHYPDNSGNMQKLIGNDMALLHKYNLILSSTGAGFLTAPQSLQWALNRVAVQGGRDNSLCVQYTRGCFELTGPDPNSQTDCQGMNSPMCTAAESCEK